MTHFTTNTQMAKREIITFTNKLSQGMTRPQKKFTADMTYGILHSQSVLLSDIATSLKEPIRKKNLIDRLSRNLVSNIRFSKKNYDAAIQHMIPQDPIVLVDDTDIVKPFGEKFEALGLVKDGSSKNDIYEKGYHVTEMVVLSKEHQPISLFSHIHSSSEKNYSSANTVTKKGIQEVAARLGGNPTFVLDRGYDQNALLRLMYELEQTFILRIKRNRKILHKGKWLSADTLCASRKGKLRTQVMIQGEWKTVYLSHLNVQITASRKNIYLVLVYGIGEHPMMLATNRPLKGKDDVVKVTRDYLSRWRIEEYFRFKKQGFGFENMRVRSIRAMNCLNTLLTYAITFLALIKHKKHTHKLKVCVMEHADPLRKNVLFYYYQMAKGINIVLSHARTGIKKYYKTLRERDPQVSFRFLC